MEDDLLAAMMDFDDPAPPAPRTGAPMPPGMAASPLPPSPLLGASTVASSGTSPAALAAQQQHAAQQRQFASEHYQNLAKLLSSTQPEKQPELGQLYRQYKAAAAAATTHEATLHSLTIFKEGMRRLYGPELYEKAKEQLVKHHQQARAAGQPSPSPSPQHAATRHAAQQQQAQQQAQQQQQQALLMQQRQAAAHAQQPPARSASPFPPAAGAAGGVVAGQPAGAPGTGNPPAGAASLAQQQQHQHQHQQQQMLAMQQQLMAQQHHQQMLAQRQAAAAAAANAGAGAKKRPADAAAAGAVGAALGGAPPAAAAAGDAPAAKRAKTAAVGGGGAGPSKPRKESDDVGVTVDNLIDYDQETNQLMEGLQRARAENKLRQHSQSNQQFLSEWRVGNEFYKQIQRTGGGLKVKGECFELVQLAFVAHMNQVISRALRNAQHRQDVARRSADVAVTTDPRRGVSQIERREKVKADAKAEAERAELLRLAGSKKADEETKERAQKAKAELVGKQQASLANAAVAATLGGKAKGKLNKWDKWAAARPAAGEEGGGGAAGAKGKKGGAGGKKGGKKGGAAAGGDAGGAGATGSDSAAGSDADKSKGPAATAAAGRGRGLTGTAAPAAGSDDASTVHLRDVVAVLERDPMYCRSPMLYRLLNTPRSAPTPAAAAQ